MGGAEVLRDAAAKSNSRLQINPNRPKMRAGGRNQHDNKTKQG